ncbi:MAG: HAMP domain-containing protein [Candidatus Competibacteraceae bacterium]|nr:HAMP domain-containing protein [Candidatus Competibacteraceae bacterium]
MLVSALLFVAIQSIVLKPLRHLTAVVQRQMAGDYRARVNWATTDEFGQLGRTLDTLAAHLEAQSAESSETNRKTQAELEQCVASRTQDLSEMRDRLEATLNALPDLLFEVNAQGNIYDFRANDPDVLNVSPAELIGRQVSAVLPAEIAGLVTNALKQSATGAHTGRSSRRLETALGSQWFEFPLPPREKRPMPMVGS